MSSRLWKLTGKREGRKQIKKLEVKTECVCGGCMCVYVCGCVCVHTRASAHVVRRGRCWKFGGGATVSRQMIKET